MIKPTDTDERILTDLMADEIVAEIDRAIINDLIIAASIKEYDNLVGYIRNLR